MIFALNVTNYVLLVMHQDLLLVVYADLLTELNIIKTLLLATVLLVVILENINSTSNVLRVLTVVVIVWDILLFLAIVLMKEAILTQLSPTVAPHHVQEEHSPTQFQKNVNNVLKTVPVVFTIRLCLCNNV